MVLMRKLKRQLKFLLVAVFLLFLAFCFYQTRGRQTIYKTYPTTGTGAMIDISSEFDPEIFSHFCDSPNDLKAVLPIYSRPDRFDMRKILRNTLGKWAKKLNCKIFFIIGVTYNARLNQMIKDEYIKKKDILMMGRIDAYRDLNDKAVAMVEYLSKYCRHVPYTIHLIDDTFINLELFLKRLDAIKDQSYMLGVGLQYPTQRNSSHKTYVTKYEYENKMFPLYAVGFAYAFPTSIAEQLLDAVYSAQYIWIEDVWFGGHVRETAGVKLIKLDKDEWEETDAPAKTAVGLPKFMIIHPVRATLFPKLYASVIK